MISTVLKCCIIFHALYVVIPAEGQGCFHPGQRLHTKAIMSNDQVDKDGKYSVNTIATYSCDPGYQKLNNESRRCLDDGTWNGSEPYCGVNVGSSATVSTSPKMEKNVLSDSFGECQQLNASETIFNIDFNQSYKIDLLTLTFQVNESYLTTEHTEELVAMVTYNNSTLDPKVWDKTAVLRKHYSESSNIHLDKTNVVFQYAIDNSSLGRQLSLKIVWPTLAKRFSQAKSDDFGLCGIALYSNSAIPESWCKSNDENDSETFKHMLYEDKCYVVIASKSIWTKANDLCRDYRKSSNSTLVVLNEGSFQHIQDSLKKTELMEHHYWILDLDMSSDNQNKCGRIYLDEDIKLVLFDDMCTVKFGRICQFEILKCGTPDQKNGTLMEYKEGGITANYSCPNNFQLEGSKVRHCSKGRWSSDAPTCKLNPLTTTSELESSTGTEMLITATNLSCATESNLKPSCELQVDAVYNRIIKITCIVVAVFVILICLTTGLALVYIKYYLKVK